MNVLIPSAGKRYLHLKYIKEAQGVDKVVTTEISPLAPGIHAADCCYEVPRIDNPEYLEAIRRICEREAIHLIIPLMDMDIVLFSRNRTRFEDMGIQFLLSPLETIEIGMDKYATDQFFGRCGLPSPSTFLASDWRVAVQKLHYPFLIKPRWISMKASRGYRIQVINSPQELEGIIQSVAGIEDEYVLQEYLTGTELTIDFFCDRGGEVISVVPGYRFSALSKAFSSDGGAIDQGRVFHDPQIMDQVIQAARQIKFFGPSNFQGYRSPEGMVKFTEINTRFTGATVMTRAAGRDFFQWSIDLILGKEIQLPSEDYHDIYMSSYLCPVFFEKPPVLSV